MILLCGINVVCVSEQEVIAVDCCQFFFSFFLVCCGLKCLVYLKTGISCYALCCLKVLYVFVSRHQRARFCCDPNVKRFCFQTPTYTFDALVPNVYVFVSRHQRMCCYVCKCLRFCFPDTNVNSFLCGLCFTACVVQFILMYA